MTANAETLLDVGCGTGAFTIGAARQVTALTGISWDERNQRRRGPEHGCRESAAFVTGDARRLDVIPDLEAGYDVVICLECVEHILDDRKLFCDLAEKIKPGGRLLLTTPNYYYVPITKEDRGPFLTEETGWHVRRGYTPEMLAELCGRSKLVCGEISYCSGVVSQRWPCVASRLSAVWRAEVSVVEPFLYGCAGRTSRKFAEQCIKWAILFDLPRSV